MINRTLTKQCSANSFNNRIKKIGQNVKKNKTGAHSQADRTRPKKMKANYPETLPDLNFFMIHSIPQSLLHDQYRSHTLLLLSIDKYTKGLFDSKLGQQQTKEFLDRQGSYENIDPNQNAWRCLLGQCEQISTLLRRKFFFTQSRSEKPIDALIMDLLDDNVFKPLRDIAGGCKPSALSFFWRICRVLRGLTCQLYGGPKEREKAHHMRCFVEKFHDSLSEVGQGHNIEMRRALQNLLDIPPVQLRDVLRISCLCSARALLNKLGPKDHDPAALEMLAEYYQHWDKSKLNKTEFLDKYQKAFEAAKTEFEPTQNEYSERTVVVLLSYSYVVHYIFHDDQLSKELAEELWKRTGATFENSHMPQGWTLKIQGMVEAARIQALLCHASHENKRKSCTDLKKERRSLNLRHKRGRRRHRKEVLGSRMENIGQIGFEEKIECGIQTTVQTLFSSPDQECKFLATELHTLITSILHTSHEATRYLRTSVDNLSTSSNQNCQLLAAALCDLLVSLVFGIVQDIAVVLNSVTLVLSKEHPDCQLLPTELSGLREFLKTEIEVRKMRARNIA